VRVLPSELVEFAIWVQHLLELWVWGSLFVGLGLLVGGARAAGGALVGSSFCSFLAYLLKGFYGGDHLETLVHGAVVLGSVGLVVFGLAGLRRRAHAPLGRYPMALVLAIGTVVVGTRLVLGIQAGAALPCSPRLCYRGFEEPWVQALLAFNVAFLALLFLVQAWQATRSSGKQGSSGKQEWEDDTALDWLLSPFARGGGPPFLL
jgi:asparagine N-glycosylation enzyme membrane subunit Stt3